MNVEIKSADLHLSLVEEFGLPTPSQYVLPEVVGIYQLQGCITFWNHEPLGQLWTVTQPRPGGQGVRLDVARMEADPEVDQSLIEAIQGLKWLPTPKEAAGPKLFVHGGWIFCWKSDPDTGRPYLRASGTF